MKVYLLPAARTELNDASLYYEGLREDLGDEFIEDFLLALTEVEEAPIRWPTIAPGFRRFRMGAVSVCSCVSGARCRRQDCCSSASSAP